MNITLLGSAPHLQWFARRLSDHGFAITEAQIPPYSLMERMGQGWQSGILFDDLLIDTGPTPLTGRVDRAHACRAAGLAYAELAGHWLEPGTELGFAVFAGATSADRDRLRPLLDALAPRAGAWLFCGPPGGGCYAAHTFDALTSAAALAMQAGWTCPGTPLQPPDWGAFFRQQEELATRLLGWARLYLTLYPDLPELDPWAQLARFSAPPTAQAHFSANLARLIVLALGQGFAQQEILQTLLPLSPAAVK